MTEELPLMVDQWRSISRPTTIPGTAQSGATTPTVRQGFFWTYRLVARAGAYEAADRLLVDSIHCLP